MKDINFLFFLFQVKVNFIVVYYNYISLNNFDVCINYIVNVFYNFLVIKLMFESVICGNLILSIRIFENLYVIEKYFICFSDMEFYKLMLFDGISYI